MRWTALILALILGACEGAHPVPPLPVVPRSVPYRDDAPSTVPLFTQSLDTSYGAPTLVELPDGTLFAYSDRRDNRNAWDVTQPVVRRSISGGATWEAPVPAGYTPTLVDTVGERLLHFEISDLETDFDYASVAFGQFRDQGVLAGGARLPAESWDAGFSYHYMGTGSTQLASGRLVIALLGYNVNGPGRAIYLLLSDDGGETFFPGGLQPITQFQHARPSLEALPNGHLRVRVPGGQVFSSGDFGETLAVEDSAPPPPPGFPIFHWTAETEPALLADTRVGQAVAVSRSIDEGATWEEPVLVHRGPSFGIPMVLTREGLLLVPHGVQRTLVLPEGPRTVVDWVVTRVGPGWLDAPVCANECASGTRTCTDGQTLSCIDGPGVCRSWSEPAPSCTPGAIVCDGGVLRTCDEVSGCAGWTVTPCASAFCYDAERCGEFQVSALAVGPEGRVSSAASDSVGGVAAFVAYLSIDEESAAATVVRLAADGSIEWGRRILEEMYLLRPGAVLIDADDRVWSAGEGAIDRWAMDGASSDRTALPTAEFPSGRALGLAPNGDIIATGMVHVALPGQEILGSTDPFLARISSAGDLLWAVHFGAAANSFVGNAVGAHPSGDTYVAGESFNGAAFVHRFDNVGGVVWSRTWTGIASALVVDGTDVIVGGPSNLRRYDEDGNLAWEQDIPVSRVTSVDVDGGEIVVGGQDAQGTAWIITTDASGNATGSQRLPRYLGPVDVHRRGETVVIAGSHGVARLVPAP